MYKRVLLKISGEALGEKNGTQIFDVKKLEVLTKIIAKLHDNGVEVAIVIGAGNIWRGKLAKQIGIEPIPADYMGMLGTVINAVAVCSNLKGLGVEGEVFSAVPAIPGVTKTYNIEEANKALEDKKVVFLSGGTGKPFFTTDTASTMRAIELKCDAILVGKNGTQGVYDKDPNVYEDAKFIKRISYKEMIEKHLQIMDISAIELIKDIDIEIRIFSMEDPENFLRVASGSDMGTTCYKGE